MCKHEEKVEEWRKVAKEEGWACKKSGVYSPDAQFDVLRRYHGTVLPGLFHRPTIYITFFVFAVTRLLRTVFQDEIGQYMPQFVIPQFVFIIKFMTMLSVFYLNQCYGRFNCTYKDLKGVESSIQLCASILKDNWKCPDGEIQEHARYKQIELIRLLSMGYYSMIACLYDGTKHKYGVQEAYDMGMITQEEAKKLAERKTHDRHKIILDWCNTLIEEAEQENLCDEGSKKMLQKEVQKFIECVDGLMDEFAMPVPLIYYHLLTTMCMLGTISIAYMMGYGGQPTPYSIYWFIFFTEMVGYFGIRELGIQLTDPFGDGEEALPTHMYILDILEFVGTYLDDNIERPREQTFQGGLHFIARVEHKPAFRGTVNNILTQGFSTEARLAKVAAAKMEEQKVIEAAATEAKFASMKPGSSSSRPTKPRGRSTAPGGPASRPPRESSPLRRESSRGVAAPPTFSVPFSPMLDSPATSIYARPGPSLTASLMEPSSAEPVVASPVQAVNETTAQEAVEETTEVAEEARVAVDGAIADPLDAAFEAQYTQPASPLKTQPDQSESSQLEHCLVAQLVLRGDTQGFAVQMFSAECSRRLGEAVKVLSVESGVLDPGKRCTATIAIMATVGAEEVMGCLDQEEIGGYHTMVVNIVERLASEVAAMEVVVPEASDPVTPAPRQSHSVSEASQSSPTMTLDANSPRSSKRSLQQAGSEGTGFVLDLDLSDAEQLPGTLSTAPALPSQPVAGSTTPSEQSAVPQRSSAPPQAATRPSSPPRSTAPSRRMSRSSTMSSTASVDSSVVAPLTAKPSASAAKDDVDPSDPQVAYLAQRRKSLQQETERQLALQEVHVLFDLDGDGMVDAKEFEILGKMKRVAEAKSEASWTSGKNMEFMRRIDRDRNGSVDLQEFTKYFLNFWHGGMKNMPDLEFDASMQTFKEAAKIARQRRRSPGGGEQASPQRRGHLRHQAEEAALIARASALVTKYSPPEGKSKPPQAQQSPMRATWEKRGADAPAERPTISSPQRARRSFPAGNDGAESPMRAHWLSTVGAPTRNVSPKRNGT